MGNFHSAGPNEVLVITSSFWGSFWRKKVIGDWAWVWWYISDTKKLSLDVMTLKPVCEGVEASDGVPLTVTAVSQCQIMPQGELLDVALEQFLGKSEKEIKDMILPTLEGHLRAITGTQPAKEIHQERDWVASLVREVASPDLGRMGIEFVSFIIEDVHDHGYKGAHAE